MSWQVFLSVLGKGGFKGKTLARGKRKRSVHCREFTAASPKGGGFCPSPIYLVLGQGEGLPVCQKHPPGPASPQKQNLKTSLWSSSFYLALLQGALGAA